VLSGIETIEMMKEIVLPFVVAIALILQLLFAHYAFVQMQREQTQRDNLENYGEEETIKLIQQEKEESKTLVFDTIQLKPTHFYSNRSQSVFFLHYHSDKEQCLGRFVFSMGFDCTKDIGKHKSNQTISTYLGEAVAKFSNLNLFETRIIGPEVITDDYNLRLVDTSSCRYESVSLFSLSLPGEYDVEIVHFFEDEQYDTFDYNTLTKYISGFDKNSDKQVEVTHRATIYCDREPNSTQLKHINHRFNKDTPDDFPNCATNRSDLSEKIRGRWVTQSNFFRATSQQEQPFKQYEEEQTGWVPFSCNVHYFTVKEALSCLAHKTIAVTGDSHFRTATNGLSLFLDQISPNQFYNEKISGLIYEDHTYNDSLRIIFYKNNFLELDGLADMIEEIDVLILGSGAWPITFGWSFQQYEDRVVLVRDFLQDWISKRPNRRAIWMSTHPMTHRTMGLNANYQNKENNFHMNTLNFIASQVLSTSDVVYFDVFQFSFPIHWISRESRHFDGIVLKEETHGLLNLMCE